MFWQFFHRAYAYYAHAHEKNEFFRGINMSKKGNKNRVERLLNSVWFSGLLSLLRRNDFWGRSLRLLYGGGAFRPLWGRSRWSLYGGALLLSQLTPNS